MTGWLVLLGHLGAALLVTALAHAAAGVTLGGALRTRLADEAPGASAWVSVPGALLAGGLLGFDAVAPALVGPTWAAHLGVRLAAAAVAAGLAVWPLGRALRARAGVPPTLRSGLLVLGLTAFMPAAALFGIRRATALDAASYVEVTAARAGLRALWVPTDPRAHAVLAFRAAGDGRLDEARAALAIARGLGEDVAVRLEIEAELAARLGDCASAHQLFRASLEQRALGAHRFDLRAFRLPPSLASRCPFDARGAISAPRTGASASP